MITIICLIIAGTICGVVGAGLGDLGGKRNGGLGFLLGFLLGPLGWLVAVVVPAGAAARPQGGGGVRWRISPVWWALGAGVVVLGGFLVFLMGL